MFLQIKADKFPCLLELKIFIRNFILKVVLVIEANSNSLLLFKLYTKYLIIIVIKFNSVKVTSASNYVIL